MCLFAHLLTFGFVLDGTPPRSAQLSPFDNMVRETATVPISLLATVDVTEVINDDLLGKTLEVPTPYELLGRRPHVSLPLKRSK